MPAPECSHDSMQSTVGGQGRMLGERYALGRHAGSGGWGRCMGPRPRAAAHVAIKMLGHPYAQEPALVARFTQEGAGRCRPEPSQHCRRLRQRLRGGHARSGHEGVEAQSAAAAPASRCRSSTAWRQGRRAGRRARQGPRQASPAGGRRLPPGRGARRPRRGLTVLTGRAAPARVGAIVLRNPVTRAVRWLTRFMVDGTNTASFGVASVADAPGGGGGGQVVGPARRRVPGPRQAAAMAA
jgi:hypothetical protein